MLIRFMTFFVLWGCSPSMSFGLLLAADLVVPGDFRRQRRLMSQYGDRVLVERDYNERIDLLGSIEVLGEQGRRHCQWWW